MADAPCALQASSSGMLVVPASSSADLNPDLDNPPRPVPSAAAVLYRQRAPLRREGAFYGLPGPSSTANEASTSSAPAPPPRPRGQLRREPVWHDGEDPSTVAPASELRGRDRRTIPENRTYLYIPSSSLLVLNSPRSSAGYWHPRWGPIPTLRQIHPGPGTPSARDVIAWLQQRYGTSSNAFWQAVDHVFPLPDGVDHTPLFTRILETSQWRNQDPNWMDGVEPVERVREAARADDAADSDADAESVGYFSDDDAMVEDAEDTTAAPQAGPSSLALVPFRSSSRAPSRASSVHSSPVASSSALPASSPGAGPSTQTPGHLKRARDSDGDASDEERSTPRRRLGPEPQQSPTASSSSSSATSRRITRSASHFARRGASFAPSPVAGPSRPAPAPRAPQITVTPPSRDVSFTLPRPPTEGYLAPGVGRGMRRRRSSSSSSRGSSRSSPSSESSSRTILCPPRTAAQSSSSTPGAGPSSLRGPSSPGPSGESAQRRHKRRREEAEAAGEGRSDDKRPPEDEGSSRKRPKRK